jgi:hypothetical protein
MASFAWVFCGSIGCEATHVEGNCTSHGPKKSLERGICSSSSVKLPAILRLKRLSRAVNVASTCFTVKAPHKLAQFRRPPLDQSEISFN